LLSVVKNYLADFLTTGFNVRKNIKHDTEKNMILVSPIISMAICKCTNHAEVIFSMNCHLFKQCWQLFEYHEKLILFKQYLLGFKIKLNKLPMQNAR